MDACERKRILLQFIYLLWLLLSLFQYVDADCSITTPGVETFGSECQYMCHCKNGESCDTTTGECTSGCDQYWFGPGCQYRDLAQKEYSRHASNLRNSSPKYADRGNDGDISTCSYTTETWRSTGRPWWRVLLEYEVTITDIYILTTTDGLQYFPEFEVTVEKLAYADREVKTIPPDTRVCYKHDNTKPDTTNIHVTCTTPLIGNQVRITLSQTRSQLILCDFRINQGRNLAFRQSVTSSAIFQDSNSFYQASIAVNGLVSNTNWEECFATGRFSNKWLQVEFDQLIDVKYFIVTTLTNGDDYIRNYKIYDTTSGRELLHDSGSDSSPATHGYLNKNVQKIIIEKTTGDYMLICELELYGDCPVNQCGFDCSKVCHCKSLKYLEDKISGICTSGCEDRWTGENGKCDVELCASDKWGQSCKNECGACKQGTCDVVTGKCTGGCQDGYINSDDECKTECFSGWYGRNCQSKCSDHCKNSCNKVNGKCIDGCNRGYIGDTCEQECPVGTYGQDCRNNCYVNCDITCHHVSGTCTSCSAGWKGDNCNTECDNGTYGIGCKQICTDKCLNVCNKVNGVCSSCTAGWTGNSCDRKCQTGKYGKDCISNCSENCGVTCHHVSGTCSSCKAGWKGEYCNTECDDGSYGIRCQYKCTEKCLNACNKVNGVCSSCTAGWTGSGCNNICSDRSYGLNCSQSCNSNCEDVCNHVNGKCTQCRVGWKGDSCDEECTDGTYGANCAKICTSRCLNACNKRTGDCSQCKDGWTGNICETECTDGTYGPNCKHNCSQDCTGVCSKENGFCNCKTGWHGDTCHDECEDGSYGDNCKEQCGNCKDKMACDKINGTCHEGCDSEFEGLLCASKIVQPSNDFPVAAIAGIVSAVVVIVIIVVIVFVVLRRRSGNKNEGYRESIDNKETGWKNVSAGHKKNGSDNVKRMQSFKHDDTVYENSIGLFPKPDEMNDVHLQPTESSSKASTNNETGDVNDYYVFGNAPAGIISSTAIALNRLTQFVKSKIANVDFFDDEFQDIPYGLQHPTNDATKPGNKGKNRYKDLYAYDHARVVLKTLPSEPNSDYINASYIKGYKKDRAYIAAQGPTETNKDEFWRMIWENNVNLIAMLTKLIEETKNKCVQYWAAKGNSKTFGKVTVFTENEEEFAEFTVRRLKIKYDGEKGERIVTHYIYTAWPDKNIPHSTCSLLQFWHKIRKHDANKTKPWLVHCSAGVGRTGTFIAMDYLYDQGVDARFIDINVCVRQLRDQRVNMVQVKEQYRYLYRIMIEALNLPSTSLSVHNFDAYYSDMLLEDQKTRKPKLKLQFETMSQTDCLIKDSETQEYACKNAKLAVNKDKNRFSNILAPDEFRPFMSTHVPGTTNYINAIYMPSYSDMFSYIITQSPLQDTAVDCCRLMIDQDIHVVVTFNDDGDNEVGVYLPCTDKIEVGPFEVTLNNKDVKHGYVIRRHTLKFKSKEHEVVQVVCQKWPTNKLVPEDPSTMLHILQDITDLQRHYENKPVLLQCLNGAERSGLFVVLLNIIERSRIEEEVSIVQVVRYLKSRREQIVPNYEQYKFCHDVLLSYTGSNSTYANL